MYSSLDSRWDLLLVLDLIPRGRLPCTLAQKIHISRDLPWFAINACTVTVFTIIHAYIIWSVLYTCSYMYSYMCIYVHLIWCISRTFNPLEQKEQEVIDWQRVSLIDKCLQNQWEVLQKVKYKQKDSGCSIYTMHMTVSWWVWEISLQNSEHNMCTKGGWRHDDQDNEVHIHLHVLNEPLHSL